MGSKTIKLNNIKIARSLKDKTFGLLAQGKNSGILINTRFGIHTFGLNSSIDVIILNKNMRVVKIKENMPPQKIFIWNPMHEFVLEMPSSSVANNKINIGDKIELRS